MIDVNELAAELEFLNQIFDGSFDSYAVDYEETNEEVEDDKDTLLH